MERIFSSDERGTLEGVLLRLRRVLSDRAQIALLFPEPARAFLAAAHAHRGWRVRVRRREKIKLGHTRRDRRPRLRWRAPLRTRCASTMGLRAAVAASLDTYDPRGG